jgi:hypothetical protein
MSRVQTIVARDRGVLDDLHYVASELRNCAADARLLHTAAAFVSERRQEGQERAMSSTGTMTDAQRT